jgi:hypothetical protein
MVAHASAAVGYLVLPVKRFIPEPQQREEDATQEPERNDPRWRVAALVPLSVATTNLKAITKLWKVYPDADIALVRLTWPLSPRTERYLRRLYGRHIPDLVAATTMLREGREEVLEQSQLSLHVYCFWDHRMREILVPVEDVIWPESETFHADRLALLAELREQTKRAWEVIWPQER